MNNRSQNRCRGFTIVEMLVAISIIGILLAITIPAVQSAREAARRVQCQNNLHQIVLAVNHFHSARNCFPPGQCGGEYGFGPDSTAWSWLARILPFLEEAVLYQEGGIPNKTLRASGIADRQIALFLCPSDGESCAGYRTDAGNLPGFAVGLTNYKGVSGANWGSEEIRKIEDIHTQWRNKGTNGSYDGLDHGDGILWRSDISARIRQGDVTDGLSRTFLIGEDLPAQNRWCSWPYANNAYGTCAIPPNFTWENTQNWANTHSFRSDHASGLNFAFADGSVHFISQDISLTIYRALATRAGNETVGEY